MKTQSVASETNATCLTLSSAIADNNSRNPEAFQAVRAAQESKNSSSSTSVLPIGVQLVAGKGDDARLLRTARWLASHVAQEAGAPA